MASDLELYCDIKLLAVMMRPYREYDRLKIT
jgi:hypothetical protein